MIFGGVFLFSEKSILFKLAKAYQRVNADFKARFQKFGITPMQLLVLDTLYEEEGLSAGEIGSRIVLDSATLSGILERMVEGGWIVKRTSSQDRRVLQILLTEKARLFQDSILEEIETANEDIVKSFRLEEKLLLDRMLKDLQK
jgi:DNA-binding MarR family transcriptional regulator